MRPLVGQWWVGMEERNVDGNQQFSCIQVTDFHMLIPLCLEQEVQKL